VTGKADIGGERRPFNEPGLPRCDNKMESRDFRLQQQAVCEIQRVALYTGDI
jgi:hypothetical protein